VKDDEERKTFVRTLGEAAERAGKLKLCDLSAPLVGGAEKSAGLLVQ